MWLRPSTVRFPVQYHKFVTVDCDTNKLVEYRVEDIPESRFDEACRFMVRHFVPFEPKLVARNGQNDPSVLEDYYNLYMHAIRQKVSVACFKRGSNELVGVNILEVLGRNDANLTFSVSLAAPESSSKLVWTFGCQNSMEFMNSRNEFDCSQDYLRRRL